MPNVDDQLDEIYDRVDDLFLDGKFEEVDALLPGVDPSTLDITLTIGWLSITKAAADKLQNREDLVRRARAHFEKVEPPHRVEALLQGLE